MPDEEVPAVPGKAGIFIVAGGGAGYAIGYRRGQNSGTE